MLVDDEGSPRLVGFGKSRVVERRDFTTAFTGTARYMAPELTVTSDDFLEPFPLTVDGGSDASTATLDTMITKRSDVYAFSMLEVGVIYNHQLTWCNWLIINGSIIDINVKATLLLPSPRTSRGDPHTRRRTTRPRAMRSYQVCR